MACKLIITKEAEADIDGIVQYIAVELNNTEAAKSFLDDIENAYRNVTGQPDMYGLCNDGKLRNMGYRKIAIKNYIIVYRVSEDKEFAVILRVFYGGMDYSKLL
jgi:plasmid stabilization system protein ParE